MLAIANLQNPFGEVLVWWGHLVFGIIAKFFKGGPGYTFIMLLRKKAQRNKFRSLYFSPQDETFFDMSWSLI